MVVSEYHSTVTMPKIGKPYPSILEFLTHRFPRIKKEIWQARISSKKVLSDSGEPISLDTPYGPLKKLYYFREVEEEPIIPFSEKIIFCNDDLLVACKPHFLPVIPGGPYVNECLLHRLKQKTGNKDLSPINRIDRDTAGLVLFSMNRKTRGCYQKLFMTGKVAKTYHALTTYADDYGKKTWQVENKIERGEPWFRMRTVPGKPNAVSTVTLVRSKKGRALFQLNPVTGKKHQLRIHLSGLGFPILNDRYYPHLLPKEKVDFDKPLQLLAKRIQFCDPVSDTQMNFESQRQLIEL